MWSQWCAILSSLLLSALRSYSALFQALGVRCAPDVSRCTPNAVRLHLQTLSRHRKATPGRVCVRVREGGRRECKKGEENALLLLKNVWVLMHGLFVFGYFSLGKE